MRQAKYITILSIAVMALGSCKKDFLNQYPQGAINITNFYKTTTDFQEALVGAYVPLRDAANSAFYMEEMRSDNTFFDYNTKDRGSLSTEQVSYFLDGASTGVNNTIWTADFNGIQRVNVILTRIKTATAVPDSIKNLIIGEAKALRAHYYFELVRLFGPLPLFLGETKAIADTRVGRSSLDSVYAQIESDLTDALAKVAGPTFASGPIGTQSGRVTKGMIATELGCMYLVRKQYDKAGAILKTVTTMGYDLMPNYADIYTTANENNKECIFEISYRSGTDGQSSAFIYRFIPATTVTTAILGVNYNNNTNNYGGWNVPTQDLVNAYEPGDKRLDASVGVIKGHFDRDKYFIADSVTSVLNPHPANDSTKYFARKYYHPPYPAIRYNTDQDWYVYRYSDVLLMLAESLNEQGLSGDALPYLNKVRNRAGLSDVTVTDQAVLRDTIAHERRIELAFENKRWFDLVRTGKAIDVMTAYGIKQKATYGFLPASSYNVTTNKMVYAIPFRENQLNPTGLWQNLGY
ncbi:MAG: RagB/SusD family nutrient uptake outer membrane protein [Chitinophagaceae bacterium]|nr:RagB/SusD family nutrient uptake outer membrane protein [Chitinophagaceae bacterium]